MEELSYIRENNLSIVQCTCGWRSKPMPISPFDPPEALAAEANQHSCADLKNNRLSDVELMAVCVVTLAQLTLGGPPLGTVPRIITELKLRGVL